MQHPQQYSQYRHPDGSSQPQQQNYSPPQQQLTQSQVDNIYEQKRRLDVDIKDNLSEIRMLNNKMAKNDYQMTYLHKLQQRQRILHEKHRELSDILNMHDYLREQVEKDKVNEHNFRATLADDYRKNMQEKKMKKSEQKRREIQAEQEMLRQNKMIFEVEQQRKRRELQENKRAALQELAAKEQMKLREKQQRERQKQQYNKKMEFRNNLETQKQSIYKQYYNHFMQNQTNLQSVYNNKTAPEVQEREKQRQEFLRKQQEQFAREQAQAQEERLMRMNQERDMLRNYLQNQIEEKQRRKSMETEQRRSFNQQLAQYQMTQKQYENMERMRRREQQKRYDEDLADQIRLKQNVGGENSPNLNKYHNPITNPIDFKMGITNPYVIRQYEQTKERYVGNQDLKLKHLAMVGNKAINN